MKARNVLALLLVLVLCAALLAGCGGGKKQEDDAAKAESEFLMGMWFAKEASYNGETADPEDIFEGTFSLYFSDNGECTMAIDQNRAVVKWELTDDGVVQLPSALPPHWKSITVTGVGPERKTFTRSAAGSNKSRK